MNKDNIDLRKMKLVELPGERARIRWIRHDADPVKLGTRERLINHRGFRTEGESIASLKAFGRSNDESIPGGWLYDTSP